MDYHVFYDEKAKMKMAGKMILNKIIGSRKRLVISLMLAVLFVDVCILAAPRQDLDRQRTSSSSSSTSPVSVGDRTAGRHQRPADPAARGGRQRRRPARWPPIDQETELKRQLELSGNTAQEQELEQELELDQEPAGTGPDSNQAAEVDSWEKLNEVGVDGDDATGLRRSPVPAPVKQPTAPVTLVRLEVEAGEEAVDVKLNGKSLMVPEINNRTRGLHALVLDQNTYAVMARRRFDTVLKEVHREVIRFLDAVRPGRIIVLASKDDMSFNMYSDLRFKLAELGSQFIPDLGFRDQWAMVTVKGSEQTLGETFSPAPVSGEYGGPLFLRVDLAPGSLPTTPPCSWPQSPDSDRRHAFCDNYEGYPGLCRCLQPHPIQPEPTVLDEDVSSIFVAVMATHRPYYLYRSLRSLAFAPGARPSNIIVYLENSLNPELEALVGLFGFEVRYVAAKPSSNIKGVISNRIMDIFDDLFTTFMEAEYVLFIEEDLECSPDIFRYFGRTHSLLVDDPSLFSVSALNRQAFVNTSHVPHVAYRVDSLPPTGFLLHRAVFETEVKPAWPAHAWTKDWERFLNVVVKKEREVVVPDVNRVYHIGLDSQFINTGMYDHMTRNLSVNPDPSAGLQDVTRLYKLNYEEDLLATIKEGRLIRDYDKLCSAPNMTMLFKNQNKTEILYFQMEYEKDISTWYYLAKCWGLWPYSTTGHHGGLWRFWLENKKGFLFHVIFIGVPFSRYSSHKPADLEPFRASMADVAAVGGVAAADIILSEPTVPGGAAQAPMVPGGAAQAPSVPGVAAQAPSVPFRAAQAPGAAQAPAGAAVKPAVPAVPPSSSSAPPVDRVGPAVGVPVPPPRSPSPAAVAAVPVSRAVPPRSRTVPAVPLPAAAPARVTPGSRPVIRPTPTVTTSGGRPTRAADVRSRMEV